MSKLSSLLDTAESFIEEELELRKNCFMPNPDPDEADAIDEAESALRCIREARTLTESQTAKSQPTEKAVDA